VDPDDVPERLAAAAHLDPADAPGSTLGLSSMTTAARPVRSTSRCFFVRSSWKPPMSIVSSRAL
jgi:hypothetical protein